MSWFKTKYRDPDESFRVIPTVRDDGTPAWSVREFRICGDVDYEIIWHCQCDTKEAAERAREHLLGRYK